MKKFRESEIKHARVAMLAFAGMFVQELAHPLFENGGKDLGPAIGHFQAVASYFPLMPAILLVIVGICEGNNIYGERAQGLFCCVIDLYSSVYLCFSVGWGAGVDWMLNF